MIRRLASIPLHLWHWFAGTVSRGMQNVITAFVQISANKGRSILTTLGIIIAVASTITVVSVVRGFGDYMTNMVQGYGTQYINVWAYTPHELRRAGMRRATMTMADAEAVRVECPNISRLTPFIYTQNAEIVYGQDKAKDIPVRGVTEQYQTIRNFHADVGRFFGPVDVDNAAYVVVLGRTLLKLLECDEAIVGDHIYIDEIRFLVVGLLSSKGSVLGDDQDKTVMIPYTTALNMNPERRNRIQFLAEATSEEDIGAAEAQITRVLRRRHGLKWGQPNDFWIERQDQMLNEFEKVRDIASSVLAGIVSISLLVGGIGIMNMMLVSVTERTREIGLRKSLGGRRRDIMLQFLTEAVVLCTVGGMVGVLFGYAVTNIASMHPQIVDVSVPVWSVVLALGFSAATGIVFGIIPAFKAALLHPIDALRHE